ncbi:MAG: RNA ligase [Lachnospiraceae bacterium]|nr:RNA ligase [Lachnospiraceae bacterium]
MGRDMKHFIDIQVLREQDEIIGEGLVKRSNATAFKVGDLISITEKVDGSNASIAYNAETNELDAFSRRQKLAADNTLNGFFDFVKHLDVEKFKDMGTKICFGEWLIKNKIVYSAENMRKWYVYSIFDTATENWLPQEDVKEFCRTHDLIYVHELYYGPFISWEHCRSFMNSPKYGDRQEGIVIRNLSELERNPIYDERNPHILKIVNDDFKESMKTRVRIVDPAKEQAKAETTEMLEGIVTQRRVEKMLLKLRDEGVLPENLRPEEMGLIAKNLPDRVYEDCLKEEPEIMEACGELGVKLFSGVVMRVARNIVLGS